MRRHSLRWRSKEDRGRFLFGRLIKAARRAKGARGRNQFDIARIAGIESTYLSQIETGYHAPPKDEIANRLAIVLDIPTYSAFLALVADRIPDTLLRCEGYRGSAHTLIRKATSIVSALEASSGRRV